MAKISEDGEKNKRIKSFLKRISIKYKYYCEQKNPQIFCLKSSYHKLAVLSFFLLTIHLQQKSIKSQLKLVHILLCVCALLFFSFGF